MGLRAKSRSQVESQALGPVRRCPFIPIRDASARYVAVHHLLPKGPVSSLLRSTGKDASCCLLTSSSFFACYRSHSLSFFHQQVEVPINHNYTSLLLATSNIRVPLDVEFSVVDKRRQRRLEHLINDAFVDVVCGTATFSFRG
ncbi:hypothetical protein AB1N83_003928 [Pleurotus pulmonarius]